MELKPVAVIEFLGEECLLLLDDRLPAGPVYLGFESGESMPFGFHKKGTIVTFFDILDNSNLEKEAYEIVLAGMATPYAVYSGKYSMEDPPKKEITKDVIADLQKALENEWRI